MITRKDYNKALDVVEAYHRQLFIDSVNNIPKDLGKTALKDWKLFHKCSVRLKNVLHEAFYGRWKFAENIEDIDINKLRKFRGAGKKTLAEFQGLRGY